MEGIAMRTSSSRATAAIVVWILALVFTVTSPSAQMGGTITNGSMSLPPRTNPVGPAGLVKHGGFLFEPEVPLQSLKSLPIWNELERLLDNPYQVALCSSLATGDPLVQNTPGTTHITGSPTTPTYPAYCSTLLAGTPGSGLVAGPNGVVRGRPTFGVALPPLLVHPLNYNPTDGEEMRLLNPRFPATRWSIPDTLVQSVFDPNLWLWTYRPVTITAGSGRVFEAEIDYNAPIRPDVPSCLNQVEAWPPEGTTICGGDTGEPRYSGFGVNNPLGYSRPAVPGVASPGTPITTQRLFDATRGIINRRGAGGF